MQKSPGATEATNTRPGTSSTTQGAANEDDAGGMFRAWLEGIIQDFKNGNHPGDPKAGEAAARDGVRNGRGGRNQAHGAQPGGATNRGDVSGAAPPSFNGAESNALTALSGLQRGSGAVAGGPAAGGASGGGTGGPELNSIAELIRTA